ncbi:MULTISPECIES: pilus assembly PilX family protein [unclassified Pseudomonas]|uniref:pilus assembly PilX family protein n=1 Tax=unclassified Pseudomonas TaxID=196821 RepID=UPI00244B258C|nr:PilX N-terminal domain-containing pilus assembly protein [Pseudomonas sp. GD03944]MDH1262347.1 PilX N-terminal domain-containing pilus assembly protein [Pseudomonas sp. GD03944]
MNGYAKQNGIVLLVSLVLLLMLTVIAITAASQSNLQLRISSNSEQKNGAFQAAESGIQRWTAQYFAMDNNNSFPPPIETPVALGTKEQFSVAVVYAGPCPGSGGRVGLNCFDIQSTGKNCDAGGDCRTTALHRQGGQRRQLQQ